MAKFCNVFLAIVALAFTLTQFSVEVRGQDGDDGDQQYPDYQDPYDFRLNETVLQNEIRVPILSNYTSEIRNTSPPPSPTSTGSQELSNTSETSDSIKSIPVKVIELGSSTVSQEESSQGSSTTTEAEDAVFTSTSDAIISTTQHNEDTTTTTTTVRATTEDDHTGGSSSSTTIRTPTPTHYPPFTDPPTTTGESTTTEARPEPAPVKERKATWAIVLIGVLIMFACLFTMLYCFRKYQLRKRRLDRRRLLSNSSQEGFFVGNDFGGSIGSL